MMRDMGVPRNTHMNKHTEFGMRLPRWQQEFDA